MRSRKWYTLGLSISMPLVALVGFMMVPVEVQADDSCGANQCEYASKCYSENACVATACQPNQRQACLDGGEFSEDCKCLGEAN